MTNIDLSPSLPSNPAIDFGWCEKWLTGEEYEHILRNAELYCREYGFEKYGPRQHPLAIYEEPYNGLLYFVEGKTVGSEFGFPRVDIKKKYRWKKMNFTTDLPKRQPVVTYIVASAIKCEKFFPVHSDGPSYRMHAVVLTDQSANSFILCHVRKLSEGEEPCLLPSAPRTKRQPSPCPLKKPKKEDSGVIDGLYALLEAAEREEQLCKKLVECDSSDDEDCEDQSQKLATAASSGDILAQV